MPSASAKTPLTRERVLDAAIDLVDREGLQALSMRRLANELDAGTMSLYNHVADKHALQQGMVERVIGEVEVDVRGDWPEILAAWATATRAALLRHRRMIPIVVTQHRPTAGRSGQQVIEAMAASSLDLKDAVLAGQVVVRYLTGSVALDAAPEDRKPLPTSRDQQDHIFQVGLQALLEGLRQRLT